MNQVAFNSEKGQRYTMEDTYFYVDLSGGEGSPIFAGIYDGHNGAFAAEYARDNLHNVFLRELKMGKKEEDAFKIAFQEISINLADQESGATAVDFYLRENRLFYANAGDARLVVINHQSMLELSEEHRVNNKKERQRIIKAGGIIVGNYVIENNFGLMPTRTIGDQFFKNLGVIATPETGVYTLMPEDRWILAASDGLFDYIENNDIVGILSELNDPDEAVIALTEEVLTRRWGLDNLTIILVYRKISNGKVNGKESNYKFRL